MVIFYKNLIRSLKSIKVNLLNIKKNINLELNNKLNICI